jgi:LysR family transcriptional regulator, low CO2-responsive transcriptional regulator
MKDTDILRSDWLDAFVCFAEFLNFTQAARSLHLSQPALHVQIAKLGEALGVPLYVRRGRALELTRDGVKLLAFAREGQERAKRLVSELRGRTQGSPVVLCAGEGAHLYLLGDAVRSFSRQRTASIHVLTRDRAGTLDAVQSGEAQLGVASVDVVPDDVASEFLKDVGQVVMLPRQHKLARKHKLELRDLEGAALVIPPVGRPHRSMVARALHSAGVSWTVGAEATGWELLTHFAALGFGFTIVNAFCRVPRGMVARPLRGVPSVTYSLLSRTGAHAREDVASLRKHILDAARSAA